MAKFKRKMISLEKKIQILDRLDSGEGSTLVAKHFDLNESTIRTIKKNEDKLRACVAAGSPLSRKRTSHARGTTMELMEKTLIIWIEDNLQKKMSMDCNAIRRKAVKIFNSIKAKQPSSSYKSVKFSGSKGWFENFKKRFSLSNTKMRGDIASTDEKVNVKCHQEFNKIAEKNGVQGLGSDDENQVWKRNLYLKYPSQAEKPAVELNNLCSTTLTDVCYIPTLQNDCSGIARSQHQVREEFDDAASNELEESIVDTELNAAELVETVIDFTSYKCELENEYSGIGRLQQVEEEFNDAALNKLEVSNGNTELNAAELVETVIDFSSCKCDIEDNQRAQEFTLSILDKGLALAKELELFFVQNDPNAQRSFKFRRELTNSLAEYREIYEELSDSSKQPLITEFFKKVPSICQQNGLKKILENEQISNNL